MRKLLLATMAATMALIGGAGIANAQSVTYPALLPGTGPFSAAAPTPGTVTVRLGGRMQTYFGFESGTGDRISPVSGTYAGGSFKEANYAMGNLIYLYPSVDGVAANGLQYGAFIELRDENYINAGGGSISGISATDRTQSVYVRRSYTYLGSASFGTFRFGTADGPASLFEIGDFEGFNDGGWNGEGESLFNSGAQPSFPWPSGQGFAYATNHLVYLSPQFSGFDFGVSFEPNSTSGGYNGNCPYASPGCATLSSSTVAGDAGRRRNTIEVGGRYRGTIGPVALASDLLWVGSQHVESGLGVSERYHGLNYGSVGLTATFGGLTIGGNGMYGDFNSGWALTPVGEKASSALILGVQYTVGPLTVGGSVYGFNSTDHMNVTSPTVGNYRAKGLATGGTYSIAPGISAYLSLLVGDQKQNGYNLLGSGEVITSKGVNIAHNQTSVQGLTIGTNIRW